MLCFCRPGTNYLTSFFSVRSQNAFFHMLHQEKAASCLRLNAVDTDQPLVDLCKLITMGGSRGRLRTASVTLGR